MNHGERFDKIDLQLDKIATTMVKGFDKVDKALNSKADKADLERVYVLLDKITKQQEIDDDERLVMGRLLERHDQWIHNLADRIGYKLSI